MNHDELIAGATKGWKKQAVDLYMVDTKDKAPPGIMPVKAYVRNGVAVHRPMSSDGKLWSKGWTITAIGCGLSIATCGRVPNRLPDAQKMALALSLIGGWGQGQKELMSCDARRTFVLTLHSYVTITGLLEKEPVRVALDLLAKQKLTPVIN